MRTKLFPKKFSFLFIILLQFCEFTKQCCEVITLNSNGGVTSQLHPDILGTYKRFKKHRFVYQHLSNPHSYIYQLNLKSGPKWVIGQNFTSRNFIMSWSRKRLKYHRKYGIFTKTPPPKFSTCPLDTFGPFLVWDGQKFIIDHYFELNCAIDRIDTVEDCCENIRVASSYVNSLAMKYQKEKLGIYKAIGKMNNQLVYEKLDNFGQNYLYTWLNINRDLKWHIGNNFTVKEHEMESRHYLNEEDYCVTDITEFSVYNKYPHHVLDTSQGWNMDPSLRVECFNSENAQQCCPIVEITSNSHASNLYPEVMGTYMMSNDYQVSGRRVYHQQNGNHLVYLHDWGPNAGMEWTFARQLGNPTPKTIISGNVEHAYPLNMCLIDASRVQGFSVWDENKWKSDPTFSIVCTVFY